MHTTPHHDAGMRALPPSSTPSAMSTSPAATAAPLPPDEPPAEWVGRCGFLAAPKSLVSFVPPMPKLSMFSLPTMDAPASSSRSATVASRLGTNPGSRREPFVMGTPARRMLSFRPTVLPASGPSGAPRTRHLRTNTLQGSSSADGRWPGSRSRYLSGISGTGRSSRRSTSRSVPSMRVARSSTSRSVRLMCSEAASARISSGDGRRMKPPVRVRSIDRSLRVPRRCAGVAAVRAILTHESRISVTSIIRDGSPRPPAHRNRRGSLD